MAIFYILVYVLFARIMNWQAHKSEMLEHEDDNNIDKNLWYYIGFFTIISAIRWNVGVDCLSYVSFFKNGMPPDMDSDEWLFTFLVDFIHDNHIHFTIGLGICAFIQIYFTVIGILPAKFLLPYFAIVLFGSGSYLGMMNAVRQMMAAAIFIYAVKFIVCRKPLIYVGLILIASLIHHSSVILLPLYFIPPRLNITNFRTILLSIYIICLVVGNTPQFQSMTGYLESALSFIGYESYTTVASVILDADYSRERRAFGPMQLSYFLAGLMAIWYGKKLHEKYADVIPCFNLWYLFSTAYACLYFLVCNTSHLLIRPVMYFQLFQTIILSLLLFDLFNDDEGNVNRRQMANLFVFIIWVALCWDIIKNNGNPYERVIYKTSLFR